jgi:hypothetical protein
VDKQDPLTGGERICTGGSTYVRDELRLHGATISTAPFCLRHDVRERAKAKHHASSGTRREKVDTAPGGRDDVTAD